MAIGYLTIQARTAHDAVPLNGVQIKISDRFGNMLYELTTDESGETMKIPLETVSRDFSVNQYFFGTLILATTYWHRHPALTPSMFRICPSTKTKRPFFR